VRARARVRVRELQIDYFFLVHLESCVLYNFSTHVPHISMPDV
jgi:hypothetical protein